MNTINEPSTLPYPLLLRRGEVCARLEWTPKTVREYRRDGDLRIFLPDPDTGHAYYYTADVCRIAGQLLDRTWLNQLPPWLGLRDFARYLGLCEGAIYRACANRQLIDIRQHETRNPKHPNQLGHRRFYSRDLEWFL